MNMTEDYRGFVISWQEPPRTSAAWTANVASEAPDLYALMGGRGAKVIDSRTREDMIGASKKYIDGLLD